MARPSRHRVTSSPRRRSVILAAGSLITSVALAACGSSTRHFAPSTSSATRTPQTGVPAASIAVISGWADALRSGREAAAAAFWAHPSVMVNGTDEQGQLALTTIHSEREAILADQSLPCGATYQSSIRAGPYVDALFSLGPRSGVGGVSAGCGGPARVDFLITGGRISRWIRVANSQTPPPPVPNAPGPGGGSSPPSGISGAGAGEQV